jgi:hypothetical protein
VPIILFILLVILVAQVGFWDALSALLGATAIIVLFFLVLIAAGVVAVYMFFRRMGRRG